MLSQAVVNGLIAASTYLLVALGFSLIYTTSRFFHFAHGAVITLGAYLAYSINSQAGVPLLGAAVISVFFCGLLGVLMNHVVYNRLLRKGAGSLVLMLASFGIYLIFENVTTIIWGASTLGFSPGLPSSICKWHACITRIHILTLAIAAVSWVFLAILFARSRHGLLMRAVAESRELATAYGIKTHEIVDASFFIGSAFAGLAGILMAADVGMTPTMGLHALMMGVVVAIVGGIGSLRGLLLASLLVGLVRHLSIFVVGSQWQDSIVFALLLVVLLKSPWGFASDAAAQEV